MSRCHTHVKLKEVVSMDGVALANGASPGQKSQLPGMDEGKATENVSD